MKLKASMSMLSAFAAIVALSPSTSAQQWTVTNLHPGGALSSEVHGVHGNTQVGTVESFATGVDAALWHGTAASNVLLGGSTWSSRGFGAHGNTQVGLVWEVQAPPQSAALWSGTPGSLVNLHPAFALASEARATDGAQQVGVWWDAANVLMHAALWSGTAASFRNLHPRGQDQSWIDDVKGGVQVGGVNDGNTNFAGMWTGTAASFVDLMPAGAVRSEAHGIGDGQIVGTVFFNAQGNGGAALWTGTAASYVNLSPAGSNGSRANDAAGGMQVGYATFNFNTVRHAGMWSGTAASWVNLHNLLPAGFTGSQANSIWTGGNTIHIGGWANNGFRKAILWTFRACYADCDGSGTLDIFDFLCFQNSFVSGEPYACDCDPDPVCDIFDFLCFQNAFVNGCP